MKSLNSIVYMKNRKIETDAEFELVEELMNKDVSVKKLLNVLKRKKYSVKVSKTI